MDTLRKAYRITVIIGLAMMASLVLYWVVVALVENGTIVLHGAPDIPSGTLELIKFVFLGLSAVIFFLIRPVNRMVLRAGRGSGAAPDAGQLTAAAVVTYALCEVPAIIGLVLFFLGRNVADFYLFLIISLLSFSSHFPKYSQWEELARPQGRG